MHTTTQPRYLPCSGRSDCLKPKAPTQRFWPFGQLTPHQERQQAEQVAAMAAGELRRMPTVFGGLDEVRA